MQNSVRIFGTRVPLTKVTTGQASYNYSIKKTVKIGELGTRYSYIIRMFVPSKWVSSIVSDSFKEMDKLPLILSP